MSEQPKYPTVKKLMDLYRKGKKLKITDLHKLIMDCGWQLSYDATRKYDRGLRNPDPYFLILAKHCLELNDQQWQAILDAIVGDYQANLFHEFDLAEGRLHEMGLPCMEDYSYAKF
jgi:hypothetical protein